MANIAVLGTFDTKGIVHQYMADLIRRRGDRTVLIDFSLRGTPQIRANIDREEVLLRAGHQSSELGDERGPAAALMSECLGRLLKELYLSNRLDGLVTAVGGVAGEIVSGALARLPFGLPCVFVSHLPAADFGFSGVFKDLVIVRCLLKPDRVNKVVRPALVQAVGAVCGMVEFGLALSASGGRQLVLASHFGGPDSGLSRSYSHLEDAGLEVHHFSDRRTGGRLLDAVVGGRQVSAVMESSFCDIADAVVGGAFPALPDRMGSAARLGVPCVVCPGGADVIHFHQDSIPKTFAGRQFLDVGEGLVLMRTSPLECARIGEVIAERVNAFIGRVTVCLPLRGVSRFSIPGEAFHDPEADRALFDAISRNLRPGVRLLQFKTSSEDAPFSRGCAEALLENIAQREQEFGVIRRVTVFKNASETLLSEASRLLERFSIEAGTIVQKQGGQADGFYLLVQGRAEIIRNGIRVTQVGPGAVFGENSLMFGVPDDETVQANEACEMMLLRQASFERLLDRHPELEDCLARLIQSRLRQR